MSHYHQVAEVLIDIEAALRQIGCWDAIAPAPEALRSEQPFAVDTLNFGQWLQFVFVPKMHFLVAQKAGLPTACGITPMAEEYFRGQQLPVAGLLAALTRMDNLLGGRR
ncbi:MAG: YqcC family protein [Zhongshania sp.]|uniref:YqcC family protein n=1 Tax=Zhongshania sp. TaxID=1971902 RepID=UPI0026326F29|nr:YqcC family protein [Zhongshania sp.]MDF1692432.1 YqcC family protein [Zhongshania sp.]